MPKKPHAKHDTPVTKEMGKKPYFGTDIVKSDGSSSGGSKKRGHGGRRKKPYPDEPPVREVGKPDRRLTKAEKKFYDEWVKDHMRDMDRKAEKDDRDEREEGPGDKDERDSREEFSSKSSKGALVSRSGAPLPKGYAEGPGAVRGDLSSYG